ncbi:snaclec stejaggregin-A subunit beta-1-like [Dunckerocampus dactyliophorus]|uniref:snaclec stejaggregin-A subunit beta-1-like n=1 Tax=Dunckerocampus dactyliophorus TaxID=161453 RepID=UPI0024060A18|nr:snaclec stejaggregin-A subunit beta-1-like [Dunckerocampus dactyliophorus]
MALALRVLFLLCGISGLLTGAWSLSHHGYGGCCPRGWNQLNDHCYSLKHEAKTFADAASVCQTLGGNLVSIHSYLENLVTVGLLEKGDAKFAWIGLHDPAEVK